MKISFDIAAEGILCCLQNAQDLLNEAKLLYANGRHVRAFCLAVLAYEEAGKPGMIYSFAIERISLKEYNNNYRTHQYKHIMATLNNLIMVHQEKGVEDVQKRLAKASPHSLEVMKQKGFYVDFNDNRFISPAECITPALAQDAIKEIQEYIDRIHCRIPKEKERLAQELKEFSNPNKWENRELDKAFLAIEESLEKNKRIK